MIDIFKLCDELELNMTMKRHHSNAKYDVRITHPQLSQPILTATGFNSFDECVENLNTRLHAIENMRVAIEKRNKKRKEAIANLSYFDNTDEWQERFY